MTQTFSVHTTAGESGLIVASVPTPDGLQAVVAPIDGQVCSVQVPPSPWIFSATSGAGFESDGVTTERPGGTLLGSNGRWYNQAASPTAPTVAALRLAKAGVHQRVRLLAYSTLGDGGGGEFYWDASSTATDDGGTTIVPTGLVTGRWKRQFSGALNVRWFGAKGDPAVQADDSDAIRMAIACDKASRVELPPGVYRCGSGLVISYAKQLVGIGSAPGGISTPASNPNNCAVIERNFAGDLITITGVNGDGPAGVGSRVENMILRQIYGGGGTNSGSGIVVRAASDTFKPTWWHIDRVNTELAVGADEWTYGIDCDGLGTTGAPHGSGCRDGWVSRCRLVADVNAVGAMRIRTGSNIVIRDSLFNLAHSYLEITGSAGDTRTFAVHIHNLYASAGVHLDFCTDVTAKDGTWQEYTDTADCAEIGFSINALTTQPTFNAVSGELKIANLRATATSARFAAQRDWYIPTVRFAKAVAASIGTALDQEFRLVQNNNIRAKFLTSTGQLQMMAGLIDNATTCTYGASSVSINAAFYNAFEIAPIDGGAFAIPNPTGGADRQSIAISIRNESGGALGAITWGSKFRMAAWTSPAAANSRTITFRYFANTDTWREESRTPADVAN